MGPLIHRQTVESARVHFSPRRLLLRASEFALSGLAERLITAERCRPMATDLYAKCPCGSGKKIKFCCRDIISDIERIERMLRGEQRTAAIEKIDKLLSKHPDRPALLALKAQALFELNQVDDAKPVIDRLLEVEPDNATALAMKATLAAVDNDLQHALKLLHRAMRMSDGVLSPMVYQ